MISFAKKKILLIVGLLLFINAYSQSLHPPKTESPNAASLGKFGEVPVNLFTGTPDISIPLHTLSYGNIHVPVSLRYHSSSVKPAQQPGWVGIGWDVESVGSISRQVRGALDEFYIDGSTGNPAGPNVSYYYPYPGQAVSPGGNLANLSNWYSPSQLAIDFTHQPNSAGCDVEADEFSFNVDGHSGKFYYEGTTNGWKVISDENITVQVNTFMSPLNVSNAIRQFTSVPGIANSVTTSVNQSRMFGSFILTVPDGTKYYFGDIDNNNGDAVEFSSPFMPHDASGSGNATPEFTANTWLLKKIVDVKNNTVNFSYTKKYPTCNLNLGFYELNASCAQNNVSILAFLFGGGWAVPLIGSSATYNSDFVDTDKHFGLFQWPLYLTSINSPNEIINFQSSETVCTKYTNDQIYYRDIGDHQAGFYNDNMLVNQNPQYINWEQLDKIIITDNMHNSNGLNNYNPNIIKQFQFTYNNITTRRLTLNSMKLLDRTNQVQGLYNFGYNSDFSVLTSTPVYADGNYTDHWGYFNASDINLARSSDLFTRKQPNASAVPAGLLNQITYPTGGSTLLTWESNDYSRVVDVNRQSYNSSVASGGGNRIAEIKNIQADGTVATDKKYYYKTGYTAGANVSLLVSSGVLNGVPQYSFSLTNRTGVLGHTINNVLVTYFSGIGNYSYTGQGAAVGYDEVVEVNADGSYTKNFFTNYGPDLNGVSHWDISPAGYLGWDPSQDAYFPRASLELERGKPTGLYQYSSGNALLQKTVIAYRNDAARFNNGANLIDLNGSYGSVDCGDALVLASARPVYNFAYYPVSKTVTSYDQVGGNPMVHTTQFDSYNSDNLLKQKTEINSKGESIVTIYTYPTDYPSASVYQGMVAAHILSPVIQTGVTNNGATKNISKFNYTQPYTGIYVPQTIELQIANNSSEIREQVNQFDSKGHPQEVQKVNGVKEVYLWGCNGEHMMAKITGSNYMAASALINQSMLDQAGVGYNSYTDADLRTELNHLRTGLPNAMVTTYTYACGIGISSETDPANRTIFYDYDPIGRLMDIRDQDFNLLKKFCYNYAGQSTDCSTTGFTNDLQQATFTNNTITCGSGTTAGTYTYTVPAGTFTSFVDKPSANQLAVDAMNTNGQAMANTIPCQAAVSSTNNTNLPWNLTLTNTITGVSNTYPYAIYPSSTPTFLSDVGVGTYNISLVPMYAGSVTSPVNLVLNGSTYSGISFTLNNISISTAVTFAIQSAPPSGPCSFTMSSGFSSPTNNINNSGTTASFYMVFYSSSPISQGNSYLVATVNGACRPSSVRSINYTGSGRTWTITIYPTGQMYWQLAYGSATIPANTTISTSTLTYNL